MLMQKQVRRITHHMHLKALHANKLTSIRHPENPMYPYLLGAKEIKHPNQVWISDLTYINLPGIGYVYLFAIMNCIAARYFHGGFPTARIRDSTKKP